MKPWVYTNESNIELRRSGTITRVFVLRLGSAAPLGLNKCIKQQTQGLRPGLCRSIAPLGLFYDKSKISVSVSYSFRLVRRTYLSNLTKHFEPIAFRGLYDIKLHRAQ